MLNLFLGQGIKLQEPGTEQQVWNPRNARSLPKNWANGMAKAIITATFSSQAVRLTFRKQLHILDR